MVKVRPIGRMRLVGKFHMAAALISDYLVYSFPDACITLLCWSNDAFFLLRCFLLFDVQSEYDNKIFQNGVFCFKPYKKCFDYVNLMVKGTANQLAPSCDQM